MLNLFSIKKLKKTLTTFTLAEVLITLGIIGVVSALTIPNLVSNYQKKVTGIKLKKAYVILSNALRMAEADYGGGTFPLKNEISTVYTLQDTYKVFENYFVPYLKGANKYQGNFTGYMNADGSTKNYLYYLAYANRDSWCINNGMCFVFMNNGLNYAYIIVDLNGPEQGPNKVGKDTFYFAIHFNENSTVIDGKTYYIDDSSLTLDQIYEQACSSETSGQGCTEIIMRNNWEIPNDVRYPW